MPLDARCDRLVGTLPACPNNRQAGRRDHGREHLRRTAARGVRLQAGASPRPAPLDQLGDRLRVHLADRRPLHRLARAATKMLMRKRFGRIIAITSIVGVTGNPGQANYTASKAGIIGLIKTLGGEYAKRNVTANCIAPGFIATPMTDALNDKQRETILTKVPAAPRGTPGGNSVSA